MDSWRRRLDQLSDANPQSSAVNVVLTLRATFGCRLNQLQCFPEVVSLPEPPRMVRNDERQFFVGQCAASSAPTWSLRGHRLIPLLPQRQHVASRRVHDPLDQPGQGVKRELLLRLEVVPVVGLSGRRTEQMAETLLGMIGINTGASSSACARCGAGRAAVQPLTPDRRIKRILTL